MGAESRITNSTIARIAGNIASGLMSGRESNPFDLQYSERIAYLSVRYARLIVEYVEEPQPETQQRKDETT